MQRLLILLHCIIITCSVTAQTVTESHLQQYTTDNGLPSNGIKGMQWDEKTGFLWMATEAGIVRFNGVDFRSFTQENMPVIASERMLFIVQNNAGSMYMSDQPGNIFSIEKSKPVLWMKTKDAHSVLNPYLNYYYLLGVSDTLFHKNAERTTPSGFSFAFNSIVSLNDTSCLILHLGALFYNSISVPNPIKLRLEQESIRDIFKIGNQLFILNNKKEIFLLSTINHNCIPVSVTGYGSAILKAANTSSVLHWQTGMKNPVFIDRDKAWLLTYEDGSINATLIATGIPPDSYVKSVQYSEKNNLLFIGTESKGLIVITRNRVLSKKRKIANTNNRNSYYSQIELPDGNILTNEDDIIGDHPINKSNMPVTGKFTFNISYTGHSLWYTQTRKDIGYNCLYEYNSITGQTKVFPKIKGGDIVVESGGSKYLANPLGIGMLDGDSLLYLSKFSKTLSGTATYDFAEISPGVLAIATCSGLLRFNTATRKLDTLFSKPNTCIRSIWKYKDYVFLGSYGSGFYVYKNGIIKLMPLDKNKYLLYSHCFVADDEGYCWISTNRGLFKASIFELIDAFENDRPSVYYHYFGKKDGMEMTELNGGCTPCALLMRDKTISFPTMDGLLWVNPEKAMPILPSGEIFVDEILVNSEKINVDSLPLIKLSPKTQELVFLLGFSSWCNKENIYLDYQLNDTVNWKPVNAGSEAVIRLSNLSSGNYLLRIRKLNGFGINNYTYKTIRFSISTPWYKKWWFYALCLLTLLAILQLIFHIRTRRYKINQRKLEKQVTEKTEELLQKNNTLEKNNSINNRLISIISHDIITPLKFLNVAGKNLLEKKSVMPEELKDETIKEITTTSKELQLLSTNILNWIKYQNENRRLVKEQFYLQEMLNQVFSILNSMAHQKNLKLVSHVEPSLQVTQYFEALKILIYNLVTNAIHFSENGSIIVNARETENKIIISVSDEGVGMTADQIKNIMADQFIVSSANMDNKKGNGLGYLIIKDLLKMMNAQLSINSEKGKGTTVYVEMPK